MGKKLERKGDMPKHLYVEKQFDQEDVFYEAHEDPGQCAAIDETVEVALYRFEKMVRIKNDTSVIE